MTFGPVLHKVVIALCAVLVLMGVMSVRAVLEARAHRAAAQHYLGAGDLESAIVELRCAARWTSPLGFAADSALDDLMRLGAGALQRDDRGTALMAFRAAHAAIHAGRSVWMPNQARLAEADAQIARLMTVTPTGAPAQDPARVRAYAEALAVERPRPFWTLAAVLGFVAWVSGAVVFMTRGLDAHGRLVRRVAKRSGLSVVIGWIAFVLGLRFT